MFLTSNEIEQLTGYKRKVDQRLQLQHMGIHFHVNKLGKPVVFKSSLMKFESRGSIGTAMPDFEALRELDHGTLTTHR